MLLVLRLNFDVVALVIFLIIGRFVGSDGCFTEIDGGGVEVRVAADDSGADGSGGFGYADEGLHEIVSFGIELDVVRC